MPVKRKQPNKNKRPKKNKELEKVNFLLREALEMTRLHQIGRRFQEDLYNSLFKLSNAYTRTLIVLSWLFIIAYLVTGSFFVSMMGFGVLICTLIKVLFDSKMVNIHRKKLRLYLHSLNNMGKKKNAK